jgi:hypothetical protein
MDGSDQGNTLLFLGAVGVAVIVSTPNAGDGAGGGDFGKANLRSQNLSLTLAFVPALIGPLAKTMVGPEKYISQL